MEQETEKDVGTNKRTAVLAVIALVLLLAAAGTYRYYRQQQVKNTSNNNIPKTTENNTSTSTSNNSTPEKSTTATSLDTLNQQIESNPTDPNLYAQKSDILYNSGDKAAALSTVQDGLLNNPDSELLKSKQDVLSKDYFQSSNTDAPRQ